MTKEYRVEIKVKNNIFLLRLEMAGYKTVGEFGKINNLCPSRLGAMINLKEPPLNKEGKFFPIIIKAAEALNCSPEDLFSESQLHLAIKSNKRCIAVNEAEMKFMIESKENEQKLLEDIVYEEERHDTINQILTTLTPREEKVLNMRFGRGGYDREHNLGEIGEECDISRERVRQIEARALRKLRHPSRADQLKEFI